MMDWQQWMSPQEALRASVCRCMCKYALKCPMRFEADVAVVKCYPYKVTKAEVHTVDTDSLRP